MYGMIVEYMYVEVQLRSLQQSQEESEQKLTCMHSVLLQPGWTLVDLLTSEVHNLG